MTVNTLPSADLDLEVLLAHKETIADGVVRLVFRHPAGDRLPPWSPGAHVDLVLRPDLVRQYSLCGDPGDRSVLEVAVLRERAGRGGSAYVHDALLPGDRVRIRGPRNNFPFVHAQRYLRQVRRFQCTIGRVGSDDRHIRNAVAHFETAYSRTDLINFANHIVTHYEWDFVSRGLRIEMPPDQGFCVIDA